MHRISKRIRWKQCQTPQTQKNKYFYPLPIPDKPPPAAYHASLNCVALFFMLGQFEVSGVEIEYFEALMTKMETSGRGLAFGVDDAGNGAHIWRKNEPNFENTKANI